MSLKQSADGASADGARSRAAWAPVLRTCLRAALTVPLQYGMTLGAIFRETVWPHVLGAPDLKVVARAEHATQRRGAASAATARAAMASGGGRGESRKQPKKGKRKKGKKRRY